MTVAWIPLAVLFFQGNSQSLGLGSASPLLGVALLTTEMMHVSAADWPVARWLGRVLDCLLQRRGRRIAVGSCWLV